jgi:hypothetical protein
MDTEKGIILHPTAGLKELCDLTSCTEVRALHKYGNYLYALAQRGATSVLWRVDSAGGFSELGTVTTSANGPAWIVNNATQICIVDGVSGFVYTPSTGQFVQITSLDFPGAGSVDYQDGYGLFSSPGTNHWFFSSLNNFKTFNSLDFYSKESKPDNIISLKCHRREPYIFGETATEIWYNAGGDNMSASTPTFARNTGGLIEHGCGAAASPSTFDGEIMTWLTNQGQVVQVAGYNARVVSNQMFDRAVRGYSLFSDAIAFSYRDQGHIFYQITFPAADETWVLDGTTQLWCKRSSYLDGVAGWGRHRANCHATLNNKHYVGDYSNGKIYEMSTDYYDDAGQEIKRVLYSKEIESGLERTFFPSISIQVEPGVGLESGLDPQIMLEFSSDGGHVWSNEMWRSAGLVGQYTRRAIWHQQGSGFRRMYRATFTDPVEWRILGIAWPGSEAGPGGREG